MSALNCFVGKETIHLFTDGIIYAPDPSGRVIGIGGKIYPLPRFNAVVGCTGYSFVPTVIQAAAAEHPARGFTDLLNGFLELLRDAMDKCAASHPRWGAFQVLVAGIDDMAPRAFIVDSDAFAAETGSRPFAMRPITQFKSPATMGMPTFSERTAERDGLRILQAQRDMKCRMLGNEGFEGCAVGGFAEYTKVTKDRVTSQILKRWPDAIGEPVDAERTRRRS